MMHGNRSLGVEYEAVETPTWEVLVFLDFV